MRQQHTPSPHNSPIYDWAKLLSMRRIKSRAARGKIRGGWIHASAATCVARLPTRSPRVSKPCNIVPPRLIYCKTIVHSRTTLVHLIFFTVHACKIWKKLNMASARGHAQAALPAPASASPISGRELISKKFRWRR